MNKNNNPQFFNIDYVRNSWINFFKLKNYKYLHYSSLIPKNDKSLLWINSGVASLKEYFSNLEKYDNLNLVNCQKVVRFNDIENIDSTSYHQTLFEMLGVFSIRNEKIEEIIPLMWEWFTSEKWLNLNKKKIFITVWEEDEYTIKKWENLGIDKKHLLLGKKNNNFWDMGEGPCGPSTELYFFTPKEEITERDINISDLEKKEFIELGNIVFPMYYNEGNNIYKPLGKFCLDIGVGLERICMVLQSKGNTFEIDVWETPIDAIIKNLNKENLLAEKGKIYCITDHLRTLAFAMSDGENISSKGRGYILKKLIKRICTFSFFLNLSWNTIENVITEIIKKNESFYNELKTHKEEIFKKIKIEFEKETQTLNENYKFLSKQHLNKIDAEKIFFLYDTKGIPLAIIKLFLKNKSINFPETEFNLLLEKQRNKSFDDRKKKGIKVFSDK